MKTYIKDCSVCGVVFEARHHHTAYCSEECRQEKKRRYNEAYNKKYYEENREEILEQKRDPEFRERTNALRRERRTPAQDVAREEAKRLKPVLDALEFKPDNLSRIACMVDYIEETHDLRRLLDWYWISDAKEYLDEQQY
jgi:predicted Holliday junction resolvase-like endonuclease